MKIYLETVCVGGRRSVDIQKIREFLMMNGHSLVDKIDNADKVLVFGCAFSNYTEDQSMTRIKELAGRGYDVVPIGCIVNILGDKLTDLNVNPARGVPLRGLKKLEEEFMTKSKFKEVEHINTLYDAKKSKASIQVCWGCDSHCTYCGDKMITGDIRSRPMDKIIDDIGAATANGFKYIELLGDDVGAYGRDIDLTLVDLLALITARSNGDKFEITMQEVNVKYLIEYRKGLERVFDRKPIKRITLGFQSANDRILKLMGRGYTGDQLRDFIKWIQTPKFDTRIRFHAMMGFPTETEEEFLDTLIVICKNKFDSGSIFFYSDRPYTSAYKITPKVIIDANRVDKTVNVLEKSGYTCNVLPFKIAIGRKND